jgi:hypothetical protein
MNCGFLMKTRFSVVLLTALFAAAWFGLGPRAWAAAEASPCATNPDSGAFDFWLGAWTVAAPGGQANATSRVALELGKCLVVERWNDGRGHLGENLFGYSADDKEWHGLFADNEGRVHVFVDGKVSDGTAVFTGPSRGEQGQTILNRVTIRRVSDNHVEQVWQKSSDNGKTWTDAFRGEYTRKQP